MHWCGERWRTLKGGWVISEPASQDGFWLWSHSQGDTSEPRSEEVTFGYCPLVTT
jgi:hypothetical protein